MYDGLAEGLDAYLRLGGSPMNGKGKQARDEMKSGGGIYSFGGIGVARGNKNAYAFF
jgi:hypothetical protein